MELVAMEIEVTAKPSDDVVRTIEDGLVQFNEQLGASDRCELAVLVRNEQGEVVGGLLGFTARGDANRHAVRARGISRTRYWNALAASGGE
jgi:hypothetical protein